MKLSDIARLAGVSLTTASYVVNGKAEQKRISPATVARVQAVVEAHGFRPDPQAAGLRRGRHAPSGSSSRTWRTPAMRAWPSCWSSGRVPRATRC